jgi:hypothetical protein
VGKGGGAVRGRGREEVGGEGRGGREGEGQGVGVVLEKLRNWSKTSRNYVVYSRLKVPDKAEGYRILLHRLKYKKNL